MSENLMQAIVEMVKQGGTTALWVYVIHTVGAILKFGIGFGCLLVGLCKACKTIKLIADELIAAEANEVKNEQKDD